MSKYIKADGRARGKEPAAGRDPALTNIDGAIDYLGKPSRSKFYADLLPQLDVVKFGARTMVTVASLDRLIAAHRRSPAG
jgi:hypothetical protein